MSFDLRAQPPVVVMRRRETARRKTRNYDDLSRTNTEGIFARRSMIPSAVLTGLISFRYHDILHLVKFDYIY